jgi:hypothetical protein
MRDGPKPGRGTYRGMGRGTTDMDARDDADVEQGQRSRPGASRRAVIAAAAALLGTVGVAATTDMTGARRRGRKSRNRNNNQSNAVSVGQGGPGGAGGAGGNVIVNCDPGFTNCEIIE